MRMDHGLVRTDVDAPCGRAKSNFLCLELQVADEAQVAAIGIRTEVQHAEPFGRTEVQHADGTLFCDFLIGFRPNKPMTYPLSLGTINSHLGIQD